jgi:hypothetical protein
MNTVVLKLKESAIGEFEKLNELLIPLTVNAAIGATGCFVTGAHVANASQLIIIGGIFYNNEAMTESLGSTINLSASNKKYYFKLDSATASLRLINLNNIKWIGGQGTVLSDYAFGSDSTKCRGYLYTKDLYKMNLLQLWLSLNCLQGELKEIPSSINDLRIEPNGVTGQVSDLKGDTFVYLRLRQIEVGGQLSDLQGKKVISLVTDCRDLSGDVKDLLFVNGITNIAIGNFASEITEAYPIICSLNENLYFPTLAMFSIKRVHLNRTQLVNTLKSLVKTNFTGSSQYQVQLSTTITESAYNADTEIQTAVTALKAKMQGTYTIYFV